MSIFDQYAAGNVAAIHYGFSAVWGKSANRRYKHTDNKDQVICIKCRESRAFAGEIEGFE